MLSTGCSGSTLSCPNLRRTAVDTYLANAVRYGTARGEWFLNAVSTPFLTSRPLLMHDHYTFVMPIFVTSSSGIALDRSPTIW